MSRDRRSARDHPRECDCDRCLEKAMRRYPDKMHRSGDYDRKRRQRSVERTEGEC